MKKLLNRRNEIKSMNSEKGAFNIMLSPLFLIIAVITVAVVFLVGIAFFFERIILLILIAGVAGFLLYAKGENITPKSIMPIIVIGLAGTFLAGTVGLTATDALPEQGTSVNTELSRPSGVPGMSSTLAPRTYRNVSVEVCNNDPELPLVTDGAMIIAYVGDCENVEGSDPLCNIERGDEYTVNQGWGDNVFNLFKNLYQEHHVALTPENPSDANIWDKAQYTASDFVVMRTFDDELTLWNEEAYEEHGAENIDKSEIQECHDFGHVGYMWADNEAEVPSTHTLNTAVLMPKDKSLTDWALTFASLGAYAPQSYTTIATQRETVNVQTPEIQIILVIGALGLLLSMLGYAGVIPFPGV